MAADFCAQIEQDGYAVTRVDLQESVLARLTRAVEALALTVDLGARGGVRDVLRLLPRVRALAVSPPMWRIALAVLGPRCAAVRGIIFDKTPGANWKVSWHQDLTVAVKRRVDVVGFGSWSEKAGIVHVQPPVAILEQMLTLRLHLDPCGPANGPVRVLPGSHRGGRLSGSAIAAWRAQHTAHDCLAERGEVLAMNPLLLHASSPAATPEHRRVVHIEYAAAELPSGLEWYEAWQPADITNSAA